MKKIFLFILALFVLTGYSQGKEIEGEMICKVKSIYIVEIIEGKPEFYSGIKGSFSKGDSLIFKFFTDKFRLPSIKLLYKDKVLGSSTIFFPSKLELTDNGFRYREIGTRRDIKIFSSNYINFNLYPFGGGREIRLERYYKSDWDGVISGRFFSEKGLGEKVVTLDCRQSSDKVDDFVQYVRGLVENE